MTDRKFPKIVGLIGHARSGKTTTANIMAEKGYVRIPFAEPMKAMLKLGFGLTDGDLNGTAKEEPCERLLGVSPRYALQTLGTEWGRNLIGKRVWLVAWLNMVEKTGAQHVVADDVRFLNEIELIRDMGGEIFEVAAPAADAIPLKHHVSEIEWTKADPDWTIINDGSIEDLRRRVEGALYGVSSPIEEPA